MQQEKQPGNAGVKRNAWCRGNGPDSFRGELRYGIRQEKKRLNRLVRRSDVPTERSGFKRVKRTMRGADFS